MKSFFRLASQILLLFVYQVFCDDDVLVATAENFDKIVKENDKLVMEFYAPWCGHCKKLEPEYAKAAADLKQEGITLAKMDATEESNKEITPKFGVRGFPTIKIFRDGDIDSHQSYEGPRDHQGIVKYLKKQFGPPSVELTDKAAGEEAAKGGFTVFGVFSKLSGSAYDTFTSVAKKNMNDMDFAHTTNADNIPACSGDVKCSGDTIFVVRDFDEPIVKYEGKADDSKELQKFLEKASVPKLVELSKDPRKGKIFQNAWKNELPKLLVFADDTKDETAKFKEELIKMGEKYDDLQPVFIDYAENKRQVEAFGANDDTVPLIEVFDQAKEAKYIKANAKPSDVDQFVQDFKAGKVEQYIKSAPVPEEPYEDDVKVLVASTLEDEVIKSGKDVLVEFYAPWCGHCKKLAPVYSELGARYKDEKNVLIAKMDATANDVTVADFNVKGFPTIYFYDGKAKAAKAYNGGRTLEDFVTYLEENSSQLELKGGLKKEEEEEKTEL